MGTRFRRTIKIGGVRVNVGRHGLSTSIGPRGSSITIGKRGVYSNIGIPGTGISYRSKLGGTGSFQRSTRNATPSSTPKTQSVALRFILDDETGETRWTDANGQPISEDFIAIARKQNRETILSMLESESEKFNNMLESLLRIHLETPSPDTIITYTPQQFFEDRPIPPDESKYTARKPAPPLQKNQNIISQRISFLGKRLDEANKKKMDEYQKLLTNAELIQRDLDIKLFHDRQEYEEKLADWNNKKAEFEQEQMRLKNYVEVERLSNVESMQGFLEEHLDAIEWPLETNVSFEVDSGGTQVWVDCDLPEIEMMPFKVAKVNHSKLNLTVSELSKTQQNQNYLTHIYAIGFRMIGEIFVALPSVQEIILSGFSQRPSRKTGHIEDEYLYSVKVQRNIWEKINFTRLENLNVVQCFEMFELRRNMGKTGVITPIEPFRR